MPRDPSTNRPSRSRSRPPDSGANRTGQRSRRNSSSTPAARVPPTAEEAAAAFQQQRRKSRRPPSASRTPRTPVTPVAAYGGGYQTSDEGTGSGSGGPGSAGLSAEALAQLNKENVGRGGRERVRERTRERTREGARDRTRERDRERERERERDVERERELRRERRREQDRERQRQRDRSRGYEVVGVAPVDEYHGQYAHNSGLEAGKGAKRRVVSGPLLEEGGGGRGGGGRGNGRGGGGGRGAGWMGLRGGGRGTDDSTATGSEGLWKGGKRPWYKQKKKLWILISVCTVLLVIIIIVAAVVVPNSQSGEAKRDGGHGSDSGGDSDNNGGLSSISPDSIPKGAPSWLNPFVWQDTADFNLTYTTAAVGDLPLMGLDTDWDDSAQANDKVPALNEAWGDYAKRPARGVNVGGWLSLEPFITPSLFAYDSRMGIIDEYTLCRYLAKRCAGVLEEHYATFVTEDTFREIADAGLDHVRIPFSYWAVETYDGDPYLFRTSWRYLLRAIEWCRRYGLRVNLDLHGLPGSQNGWNHSGQFGAIGWLNGTDGAANAKRSLEIHDRLSQFFAQPRYRNIISHYGLANEPRMTYLQSSDVLQWTTDAANLVRKNGVADAIIVFGDGFRGLGNWQGELTGLDNAALDVHQYVIFNTNQIVFNHTAKIQYACTGWTQQTQDSMDRSTGFGPTLVAEWSQADTDCARHLTNVGWGNRWTGTYITPDGVNAATSPRCPTQDFSCSCEQANAPVSEWSNDYKQFLKMFAEAQMYSFEKGWGWFYWVWDTEDAPQWSYKQGLAAGVLPAKAYDRDFNCDLSQIPSFSDLPETY